MEYKSFTYITLVTLLIGLSLIFPASAQNNPAPPPTDPREQAPPPTDPYPQPARASVSLVNPLTGTEEIPALLGRVVRAALGLVGSLSLIVFIYGGLLLMTAAGNEEQVIRAKNTLIWATLGLTVIFTSYAVLSFIIESLTGPAAQ